MRDLPQRCERRSLKRKEPDSCTRCPKQVLLLVFLMVAASAGAQSLQSRAEQMHAKRDLVAEKKILEEAVSAANVEERLVAHRRLAWLAWRFFQDFDAASAHFDHALAMKTGRSETLSARARMLVAKGEYRQARTLAREALRDAATSEERDSARVRFAEAAVEEAFETSRCDEAREALDLVAAVVQEQPGIFRASRLMYALAMFVGDRQRATESLRSYHWGGKLTPLYPEAGLAGSPSDVVAYSRFCRRVRQLADEHYRRYAIGQVRGTHTILREPVLAEARAIWPDVETEDDLNRKLGARFDADIQFHSFGLTFGHRVFDEDREFTQYGRTVRVRFVIVDSMVSNGFSTWFSDGRQMIGGWSGPPMTQVRRDDALGAWMGLADPDRKRESDARIANASVQDEAAARANPYGYLEGLMYRLFRRAHEGILAELESRGLRGKDLRLRFLLEHQNRHIGCVQAHETRHLIDRGNVQGYRYEMYAALSQPLFGPDPVTCLAGIFGPNIGNRDNGSGEGNGHIMRGLVAWMEAHAAEMKGLDARRPLLPQFDLLTDEQIRHAFRSMDPRAR